MMGVICDFVTSMMVVSWTYRINRRAKQLTLSLSLIVMADSESRGYRAPDGTVYDDDDVGDFDDSPQKQQELLRDEVTSLPGGSHVVDPSSNSSSSKGVRRGVDIGGGGGGGSVSRWSMRASPSRAEDKTLLEEIREVLPQSYLIFLLADLRLMSGTGRIKTRFETLVLDSDLYERNSAAQMACNFAVPNDGEVGEGTSRSFTKNEKKIISRFPDHETKSLSPAQIMSLLLLELAASFLDVETKTTVADPEDLEDEKGEFGKFKTYLYDDKNRRTLEDSMESLLRAYARMISDDLVNSKEVPNVRKRRESLLTGFGNPIGSPAVPTLDRPPSPRKDYPSLRSIVEGMELGEYGRDKSYTIPELPSRKATSSSLDVIESKTDQGPKDASDDDDPQIQCDDTSIPPPSPMSSPHNKGPRFKQMNPLTASYRKQMIETVNAKRKNVTQGINDRVDNLLPANREANTQKEFKELANALFEQGQSNANVMSSVGGYYSAEEMIALMTKGVETRDDARLEFLSKLFNEGSVSQLMAESHSRIVWINDWYPLKDLTYAIAVDKSQKRVLVVFRGAITSADWKQISHFSFESIENPVKDAYEGRKERLRVFSGFYRYLFRRRKDTGTTKYSEIANLAHKYGVEKIGEDYKLFVTGHSLGGALTMFFSFFASTEERFTRNGPVKGITFGSPYVGGHAFADTFRHQERSGKLQVVRVYNNNDLVPHLPLNFSIGGRGCLWRHDGISVILPPIPWFRKWKPRVNYFGKEKSWIGSTLRGYRSNFLFHSPWLRLWTVPRMHTLFELQDRLMYGLGQSGPGGELDLLKQTMDELYKGLEENDFQRLKKRAVTKGKEGKQSA